MLYISMDYATAVHSCCCGCGERVVTPFTATDWRMTFDGESVSLYPSVGNWNQECRSHYVIERNRVIEAGQWSAAQVQAERRRDKRAKAAYYSNAPAPAESKTLTAAPPDIAESASSTWSRIWGWVSK